MKQFRKVLSILLTMIMVSCMAIPAFGANSNEHTITIQNKESGHTYKAYQVFAGDFYEGKLSNIEWGSGVDGSNLLADLKADKTYGSEYTSCTTAEDVANVLNRFKNDSDQLDAFAKYVNDNLSSTKAGTSTEGTDKYTINVTGDGYYFVKDTGTIGVGQSATKYILQVVKDVTVQAKTDTPSIEKKIVEDNKTVDANTASVGDEVDYKITSTVPDMGNYKKYYFIVHDTLSKGLDYKEDSLTIKVGDKTLAEDTDYTLTKTEKTNGETELKIVFNNFKQYITGDAVVITYTATVNEDAVIGNEGNANEVYLEYSNNPNVTPSGEDEPGTGDGNVTGTTPKDYVITYITGLEIIKTDADGNRLMGAEFELTGTKINKVKVIREVPKEDASGTYYKLKDGTYTETAPTEDTEGKYADATTKYSFERKEEWVTTSETVKASAVVGPDGVVRFDGLAEGTYEIKEIKAPNGYNILKKPITVTITCTEPTDVTTGEAKAKWSAKIDKGGNAETVTVNADTNGRISITVENKSGTELPSTGGMGTTLFYLVGGALVATAIVLLVSKKRMDDKR